MRGGVATAASRVAKRLSNLRRTQPGTAPLDALQLISPFRFDVLVRTRFLEALRDLRGQDPSQLMEIPAFFRYFMWFKHVECARFAPKLLTDPQQLMERYYLRVERAAKVLDSFERIGFDAAHPATVLSTGRRQATDSGAVTSKPLHISDGCHRLALLIMTRQDLAPGMYRLQRSNRTLVDNTKLLLQQIPVTESEYAAFLSHGYADAVYPNIVELRRAVAAETPHRLDEFDGTVQVHRSAALRCSNGAWPRV